MPEMEAELMRIASLVVDIGAWREQGVMDSTRGSDDDDLLGAVEELEAAIKAWRYERAAARCCTDPQCLAQRQREARAIRQGGNA